MMDKKISDREKELFKKRGELLNPPIQKMTRNEIIKKMNLENYFDFIEEGRELMIALKGKLSSWSAEGIERGRAQAKKMGLYGKT